MSIFDTNKHFPTQTIDLDTDSVSLKDLKSISAKLKAIQKKFGVSSAVEDLGDMVKTHSVYTVENVDVEWGEYPDKVVKEVTEHGGVRYTKVTETNTYEDSHLGDHVSTVTDVVTKYYEKNI